MHEPVCRGVFVVGGGGLSSPSDCLCYAVDLGEVVLVDCGCGGPGGWPGIRENVRSAGLDPGRLSTLVLTHCHVDHIGAARDVKAEAGCRIVAHALDAQAIRTGDPALTAACWYDVVLPKVEVDHEVEGRGETLRLPGGTIDLLHTPGHTPGSMVALLEVDGEKILFGQDIHGPFSPEFGSSKPDWRLSMARLLELEADVLCEGHFGVIRPAREVRRFIEGQLAAHR